MDTAIDSRGLSVGEQGAANECEGVLADVIAQYHQALDEFVNGNPKRLQTLFSHRDDVSLANPVAPVARGWEQVACTQAEASAQFRESQPTHFERVVSYVTPQLAFIVEIERWTGRTAAMEESVPMALRVTTILRPEGGTWKVLHRHADSLAASRPLESIAQI
jgi:ketosteroid isomerase-like protein